MQDLLERGEKNGVKNLRIIEQEILGDTLAYRVLAYQLAGFLPTI